MCQIRNTLSYGQLMIDVKITFICWTKTSLCTTNPHWDGFPIWSSLILCTEFNLKCHWYLYNCFCSTELYFPQERQRTSSFHLECHILYILVDPYKDTTVLFLTYWANDLQKRSIFHNWLEQEIRGPTFPYFRFSWYTVMKTMTTTSFGCFSTDLTDTSLLPATF